MNQEKLNEYFSKHWTPYEERTISSPIEIAKNIADDEFLLDVGCGKNPFKKFLKNVVGIDPAFNEADYKITIEEFNTDIKFDVATCLGSINFGDEEIVARQIEKVVLHLKDAARVYWRLNPGRRDHKNDFCHQIVFFPWTFEKLQLFANKYSFTQINEITEEYEGKIRLYAEWIR